MSSMFVRQLVSASDQSGKWICPSREYAWQALYQLGNCCRSKSAGADCPKEGEHARALCGISL